MKFNREQRSGNTIRQVEPGAIRIGNELLQEDVVVTPDAILRNLSVHDFDMLTVQKLEPLLQPDTEILILGSGWQSMLPPRDLVFSLAKRGVAVEIMDTPAACRTFNILLAEGRRPAAILKVC